MCKLFKSIMTLLLSIEYIIVNNGEVFLLTFLLYSVACLCLGYNVSGSLMYAGLVVSECYECIDLSGVLGVGVGEGKGW
jgi:hypothetical protein